jgi:imidazole glycerol-phosphate synthase subunit HisH
MIAVIKYNAGNIRSVMNALGRLGAEAVLTDDVNELRQADKIIFPGVGEAGSAMRHLRQHQLDVIIKNLKQPFLGICLGMQLMCEWSEENETDCLGIIPQRVLKFPPKGKVPHMGWNNFKTMDGPLFKGIDLEDDVYFVHSYFVETGLYTTATTDYLVEFSSAVKSGNFYGVQFHPEKSADVGQRVLENFLSL